MTEAIFSEEQKEELRAALAMEKPVRELLTRSKQAGLDVKGHEERLDTSIEKLRGIQRSFFPSG